jgi:DNA invertase Pin-like site-specific DNA recombinase
VNAVDYLDAFYPEPLAYSYIRFSTTDQKKGDSLRRQIEATAGWCERNNVRLDTSLTFRDLGRSAYLGEHRKNPDRHALAAFLKMVEEGRIPRGSYLIIESLDRLTREHVRAGLMLLLGLIEAGIRIVQLSPSEMVYDDRADEMALMLAIVELSRGHRESKRKSDLSGPAWRKKKEGAREGRTVTERLPAWVTIKDGKRVLIPERAAAVKRIFQLAATGYGTPRIVRRLKAEKVPAFGKSGEWGRVYVSKILCDRRAVGDYQPRKGKKQLPDGDLVPGYYPAAVSEAEYLAARAGMAERKKTPGRTGEHTVNVFAGILLSARDGKPFHLLGRLEKQKYHVLANGSYQQGAPVTSIPYPVFERAVLDLLAEVDPREIVGTNGSVSEVKTLGDQLDAVTTELAEAAAFMDANGFSPTIGKRVKDLEGRKRDLAARLRDASAKAAHPLTESWTQCQSLATTLDNAPDPDDARLRLRSALRRIVSEIRLLIVPRKLARLAAVQVYFEGDGLRDYVILYRPSHAGFGHRKPGHWWARSLDDVVKVREQDLRRPEDAAALEIKLTQLDLAKLMVGRPQVKEGETE